MGEFGFKLGKVLIIIALVLILWTVWSPSYLYRNLGLDMQTVSAFTDVIDPFKIPITLIAIGAVLWTGYRSLKGGI